MPFQLPNVGGLSEPISVIGMWKAPEGPPKFSKSKPEDGGRDKGNNSELDKKVS